MTGGETKNFWIGAFLGGVVVGGWFYIMVGINQQNINLQAQYNKGRVDVMELACTQVVAAVVQQQRQRDLARQGKLPEPTASAEPDKELVKPKPKK